MLKSYLCKNQREEIKMTEERNLPIDTQTFEQVRNAGTIYVDKTLYIEKLLSLGRFFFLSRPHRFGKSLFLSTLQAYFEGRKNLFEGLYIADHEAELARRQQREPWEEMPVLYFDFNARDYGNQESLPNRLLKQLKKLEVKYQVVGEGDVPEERFIYLIETIYETIGKRVVILVDEYDKPLLETINDPELNDTNRLLLKAFYEVLKHCDEYIRFAFLTGVTKFSKTNLFSGANNLKDISLLDNYDAICGFTEQELTDNFMPEIERLALAENTTVEATRQRLRKEYDGYCFSRKGENVYNPFSLLNVLADSTYNYYWFETATPSYLVNYLKRTHLFVPDLDKDIKVGVQAVQDFRYNDHDSLIPLLFQSGYLTIKGVLGNGMIVQLGYPNEEVRFGFLHELLPLYSSFTRINIDIEVLKLYEFFDAGNLAKVMEHVVTFLAGVRYGNIPKGEKGHPLREQYYQTVLYAVFRLLGVYAQTEVVCATGQIDMLVATTHHVYIFEFKVNTQGTAQDAIAQIKEKEYFRLVAPEGRTLHLVGVSFDEKSRNVGEWKEEILTPDGRG